MHRYLCLLLALCVAPAFSRKRLSVKDLSSDEVQSFEIDDDDEHAPVLERTSFVLDDYRKLTIELSAERLCGQALVDYVNWRQDLWTARLSGKFESYSEGAKWGLMGVNNIANSITGRKHESRTRYLDIRLPKNFDSRTNWPQCNSIKQIRDQSSCGSCWAFGAVEAMSDRICIATDGKIQTSLSADDLLSCCSACGFGCNGGDPLAAWRYWVKDGIVTGSNYTLKQGCKPYPFPSCEHHSNKTHFPACKHDLYPTPRCEKTCQDGYTKEYKLDKFYGKTAYSVHPSVEAIQKEVFTHGPVEVAFEVYEDFLHYESGIYVHQGGKLGGGHAVKLIGWGEESGIPYWIVANSWNSDWGENGFFRILRGVDECGIESGVVGGVPKIDRYNFDNDDDDDLF